MSTHPAGVWDAFVDVMLAAGPAREGRSRYSDKPALFAGRREIASNLGRLSPLLAIAAAANA